MNAGTVLAIIVPNLVAALAIYLNWKQRGRELREARRLNDLGSVRTVLDNAAVELHNTAYVLDEVRSTLTQYGQGFFTSEKGAKPFAKLGAAGETLDVLAERLKVRFGREHNLVHTFGVAVAANLEIFRALGLIKIEPEVDAGNVYAQQQVRSLFEAQRTRIEAERAKFDIGRNTFIDAAALTAGAELPR